MAARGTPTFARRVFLGLGASLLVVLALWLRSADTLLSRSSGSGASGRHLGVGRAGASATSVLCAHKVTLGCNAPVFAADFMAAVRHLIEVDHVNCIDIDLTSVALPVDVEAAEKGKGAGATTHTQVIGHPADVTAALEQGLCANSAVTLPMLLGMLRRYTAGSTRTCSLRRVTLELKPPLDRDAAAVAQVQEAVRDAGLQDVVVLTGLPDDLLHPPSGSSPLDSVSHAIALRDRLSSAEAAGGVLPCGLLAGDDSGQLFAQKHEAAMGMLPSLGCWRQSAVRTAVAAWAARRYRSAAGTSSSTSSHGGSSASTSTSTATKATKNESGMVPVVVSEVGVWTVDTCPDAATVLRLGEEVLRQARGLAGASGGGSGSGGTRGSSASSSRAAQLQLQLRVISNAASELQAAALGVSPSLLAEASANAASCSASASAIAAAAAGGAGGDGAGAPVSEQPAVKVMEVDTANSGCSEWQDALDAWRVASGGAAASSNDGCGK